LVWTPRHRYQLSTLYPTQNYSIERAVFKLDCHEWSAACAILVEDKAQERNLSSHLFFKGLAELANHEYGDALEALEGSIKSVTGYEYRIAAFWTNIAYDLSEKTTDRLLKSEEVSADDSKRPLPILIACFQEDFVQAEDKLNRFLSFRPPYWSRLLLRIYLGILGHLFERPTIQMLVEMLDVEWISRTQEAA
jgi:hypothetical protein